MKQFWLESECYIVQVSNEKLYGSHVFPNCIPWSTGCNVSLPKMRTLDKGEVDFPISLYIGLSNGIFLDLRPIRLKSFFQRGGAFEIGSEESAVVSNSNE